MEQPLVSVIALTRNHELFCIESLDSILNQTYQNLEWVILDVASTDNTPIIIENWLKNNKVKAKFIKEKELRPITVNLNRALSFANGEYVQIISLDDILIEYKIERQLEKFKSLDESYVSIYTDAIGINEQGNIWCESTYEWARQNNLIPEIIPEGSKNVFEHLCQSNFTAIVTMLFKFSAVKAIGGFDETLSYEDHDIHLRLTRKFKYAYLNIKSVKCRLHSNNLHKNNESFLQVRDEVLIFYKHLDTSTGKRAFYKRIKNLLIKSNNHDALKYVSKNTKIPYIILILLSVCLKTIRISIRKLNGIKRRLR